MGKIIFTIALLAILAAPAFAQQDPDDPGIQDSLIFICNPDHVDSSDAPQVVSLQILAVTDDSIFYYGLPLKWYAPLGGVICGPVSIYNWPINQWDEHYDTVIASQNYVRQFGFCNILPQSDNPPLFTNGQRVHLWSLPFLIAPNTPEQVVVFDTCWDDRNGSVGFTDELGEMDITPAIQRGFLSIGSVGVESDYRLPNAFSISQNYPNPFNSSTSIEFSLPYAGPVRLEVFDIMGRKVATLIDDVSNPGAYAIQWRGRDDGGNGVPSGVYFYRLSAGGFVEMKRMLLLK